MGSRTQTVRNWQHPKYQQAAAGQRAKAFARNLSNKELDEFLTESVPDEGERKTVLAFSRGNKIRFIKDQTMKKFAETWAAKKKVDEEAIKSITEEAKNEQE